MIYTPEQAKLFTDTQKKIKLDRTEVLKKRRLDAEERAKYKADLQAMGLWELADIEGVL
ncbi:MAG: hypothetical protein GW836_00730 [Paraglaciecola sp.]|nr:hypothetical protein [Paraglaciecola sp.]